MMRIFKRILSLSLLFSCANSTPPKDHNVIAQSEGPKIDSTEKVALRHLFDAINNLPNASFEDSLIRIGNNAIRVKIDIESDGKEQDRWIFAANITTLYKSTKETQINIGSIGIGATREEAIDVCIQEWFGAFGISFIDMLNDSNSIRVSNLKVFPGLMGIRGKMPESTWFNDEMTNKIISQIQIPIKNNSDGIVPLDIKLLIGKTGVIDGECRINNQVSTQILNDLKQLNWPSSDERYMFKQFYLIEAADQ